MLRSCFQCYFFNYVIIVKCHGLYGIFRLQGFPTYCFVILFNGFYKRMPEILNRNVQISHRLCRIPSRVLFCVFVTAYKSRHRRWPQLASYLTTVLPTPLKVGISTVEDVWYRMFSNYAVIIVIHVYVRLARHNSKHCLLRWMNPFLLFNDRECHIMFCFASVLKQNKCNGIYKCRNMHAI